MSSTRKTVFHRRIRPRRRYAARAGVQVLEDRALLTTIPLETLGAGGTGVLGIDAEDSAGDAVAFGDINGDGFDDLLIAAPRGDGDANARPGAGEAYVLFGSADPARDVDLRTAGADITIYGADPDDGLTSGNPQSIASADLDNDGYDDLIIGAEWADSNADARSAAGEVYVIFGQETPPATIDLGVAGAADLVIFGADANDRAGSAVARAGDLNDDSYEDIIIGAWGGDAAGNARGGAGESYIIFGAARGDLPASLDLQGALGTRGVRIHGAPPLEHHEIFAVAHR